MSTTANSGISPKISSSCALVSNQIVSGLMPVTSGPTDPLCLLPVLNQGDFYFSPLLQPQDHCWCHSPSTSPSPACITRKACILQGPGSSTPLRRSCSAW
jgi:hypothetical protein